MKHARQDYNRIQDPTGKIPDNEPVFLLRGQDVCAPIAVQAWADEAEKRGADAELVRKARAWAAEMITYQTDKKSKVPDGPKYQAPDIIPGLGFRIVNSNGFYFIQATDTAGTCLVYAYDNEGGYLWRDRWVINEMRKFFEKGEYWAVRLGELNEGRRVVLFDPGAIQTPYEALLGEPPASWRPGGNQYEAGAKQVAGDWEAKGKAESDPNNDIKQIDTTTNDGQLLMAAIALITSTYQTNKTPFEVMGQLRWLQNEMYNEPKRENLAATGEGVKCVKCGNWYRKGDICQPCFIDSNGPDQPNE